MSLQGLRSLIRSLRQAAGHGGDAPSDADLLTRWVAARDELAFEVLVWRHGPLVLGVCRRVLCRDGDVEDAFQATFLALVKKAHSVRDGASLAAWLHRVAWRVALRVRRTSCRRGEVPLLDEMPGPTAPHSDLGELLDAEIDRLPERYRRPVVLCLLQGHSQPEAAALLGVPVGTLSSLLCRGRERLRERLARHGVGPPCEAAHAALPAGLVAPAVRLALSATSDLAGAVPARIAELAAGVIAEMSRQKLLTGLAVVLAIAVLLGGGSVPLLTSAAPRGVAADVARAADAPKSADAPKADAKDDEPEPDPSLVEPFDGKLRLKWKVLRPDEKRYSLTKNKGKLTITTQRGTIHADADRTEIKAKNIFLLRNPFPKKDFEVSVRVSGFTPQQNYQQGGLICYDDDDNYVKFTYEYNSGTNKPDLVLVRETEAKTIHDRADAPDSKTVWLRLTRRKNKYEFASSADGKKWTIHGEREWDGKGPAKVGLIAKNGGTDAPEVDVCFDEFRLRSPEPVKAKK